LKNKLDNKFYNEDKKNRIQSYKMFQEQITPILTENPKSQYFH
jgi:hypothetical protein